LYSEAYKRYVLGVLTVVYTLNFLDRGLIGLLLEPIKRDLHLSDTQLGFLTGIAFGLFYAVLGLPIARWADRGNRPRITSISIGLWGVTVMSCLAVTSFIQLVFARVAAAVGEAGCMPPTYSLVGDYFPRPAERARAMAVYLMGGPLAWLISFIVGGRLNELYGWRVAFFLMGIPGLAIAGLVKMTVAEPRVRLGREKPASLEMPRIVDVLMTVWRQRSSRHLSLAVILAFTMELGLLPWYAAFMIRSHGMDTAELGVWLGLIFGFGGTAGLLLGGYVNGRWYACDEPGQVRLSAALTVFLIPCFALFLMLPQKHGALIALIPFVFLANCVLGPTFALMQRLVADHMRATTLAVVMLIANLVGMGIGSQTVGVLSDLLEPVTGTDSLRYSMLTVSFLALWSAYHFWRVRQTVTDDLSALDVPSPLNPALTKLHIGREAT
jgi:MFS family permease